MSKFCPLFSGSGGNCIYIENENGAVLVDVGVSAKQVTEALYNVGTTADKISALFITHEHSDHISGLKTFLKKYNIPVYASEQTLCTLAERDLLPDGARLFPMGDGEVPAAGFKVKRFATSHDCPGSSGYVFTLPDGRKISVCTDLGVVTNSVRSAITGSELVYIESNHDLKMLQNGPYTAQLKLRVASDKGHLSNNACAAELPGLYKNGAKRFILAHISRNNNLPALAKSTAEAALMDIGAKNGFDYILKTAPVKAGEVEYL